jgi:hypothetical protein
MILGMPARRLAAVVTPGVWDVATKSAPADIDSGDLRLYAPNAGGSYANAKSTKALVGDAYISAQVSFGGATGEVLGFGLCDASFDTSNAALYAGETANSCAMWGPNANVYNNNSVIGSSGTFPTSGVLSVEIAVKVATRRVWIRRNGESWVGGGDPEANSTPTLTLSGTGAIHALGCVSAVQSVSRNVTLRNTALDSLGTVPSGFIAANWSS